MPTPKKRFHSVHKKTSVRKKPKKLIIPLGDPFETLNQLTFEYKITHDDFFKLMFAIPEIAKAFLKNVLPPETLKELNLEALAVQNGILGESDYFKKSAADLIYVIPFNNNSADKLHVSVILEHKSYSDPLTIFQLSRYCMHVMEKEVESAHKAKTKMSQFRFSPILPIIIHHGRSAFSGATELSELFIPLPGAEPYSLNLKAILFDLNKIVIDNLTYGQNIPEFISVLKMMQAILNRKGAIQIGEALAILRPFSKDPRYQSLIRAQIIYMLCCNVLSNKETEQIVHNDKFVDQGDENMPSAYERILSYGIEQGIEQGMERGRKKWIEQGIEQGSVRTTRQMIIQTLKTRFGNVPRLIQKGINEKIDLIVLQSLFQTALAVESMEEFSDAL